MTAATPPLPPVWRALLAKHFDAAYYLACNPEASGAGMEPLDHFIAFGWQERRNPSRTFDVAYYLRLNRDVAAVGMNPLLHYLLSGKGEGRLPQRPLNRLRETLEHAVPIREKARQWEGAADRSAPLDAPLLAAALGARTGRVGIVLSVSHDDYPHSCGGVQQLIADEQQAFAEAGWSYLHCSPAIPMPMLADPAPGEAFAVRLRLDGKPLGIFRFADLLAETINLRGCGERLEFILHHFMGHAPELLACLAEAAGARPLLWLHDYFTLCPSYALMRNDVQYCGAPPASSNACMVCGYGPDRAAHQQRIGRFFQQTRPWLTAPSPPALALWHARSKLPHAGSSVVPPARLFLHPSIRTTACGPLRIAHLGARLAHKGWHVFESLALSFADDDRYAFFHLGIEEGPALPSCIANIPVRVSSQHRDAMIEAIALHGIDVVVSWSLWPESFCFAVHEAMAGGAFIIARAAAGNVWPAVQAHAPQRGLALDSEAALAETFGSGAILAHAARAEPIRGALLAGGNSTEWFARTQQAMQFA